jgi:hypothetical protein
MPFLDADLPQNPPNCAGCGSSAKVSSFPTLASVGVKQVQGLIHFPIRNSAARPRPESLFLTLQVNANLI